MKKLLPFLLLLSILSCHKDDKLAIDPDPVLGSVEEATGKLSNAAAVDGCGLLFSVRKDSLRNDDYAINERSVDLANQFLVYKQGIATRDVIIKFQRTNNIVEARCGFSGLQKFNEILLLSVKPI